MNKKNTRRKTVRKTLAYWRSLPKVQYHEHLDCSVRPATCLELWAERDFQIDEKGRASGVAFPEDIIALWKAGNAASRRKAVDAYSDWVASYARSSLVNYIAAIDYLVLPIMQSLENITRITRERIEDAIADGHIAIILRFAPQLHLGEDGKSNTLEEVVKAAEAGLKGAEIPTGLILCCLRQENEEMATALAALVVKHKKVVGLDLAGAESLFPGILPWWIPAARTVKAAGKWVTSHLWETNEPTREDLELLEAEGIEDLGHGFRGNSQGNRVLQICVTSNEVTGQVASFGEHPVDSLYRSGRRVTIHTDGTLLTKTTLSQEYRQLARYFGWTEADFLRVNLTAVEAGPFSAGVKARLVRLLRRAYKA
jgi:adenosine deaminase